MALKQYKPTSPARRGLILVDKSALWKGKPVKTLTEGKRKTGGRNNKGHVTSRGIAGGHKQKYRYVDFKRRTWDVAATVERIEYDPNRSAFIALVTYEGGEQAYIIAPQRLAPGDQVIAGKKVDVKPGNAMEVGQMPVGTIVHNVELKPGKGGQIARAAGTYVQVVGRDRGMVIVRLNSGEQRYVRSDCMATVGAVSNPDNQNQNFGKAGRTRWMGKRPLTRGVAHVPGPCRRPERQALMGKAANPRRVGEKEALAVGNTIRGSARKLNLVATMIRGRKVEEAMNILKFSSKGMADDVRKVLASAVANAENNHNLDVDALIVAEASVGKALSMKRFATRARGRSSRIVKPFSRLRVVVREQEEA